MHRIAWKIEKISFSRITTAVASIASIASFTWLIYNEYVLKAGDLTPAIITIICTLIFLTIGIYSLLIRKQNHVLRQIPRIVHHVNHIYRNRLRESFCGEEKITNREQLIERERYVLTSVCQRIQKIFARLIDNECLVTVKLITENSDKIKIAHTYLRSENDSERDGQFHKAYEINTGANTAFDEAIKIKKNSKISHFCSPDLSKDVKNNTYSNERSDFGAFYRSTIVVPITCKTNADSSDDIGFLCIDTRAANRLGDSYHIQLLAAFADQMYNFMSLMRGKYDVLTT